MAEAGIGSSRGKRVRLTIFFLVFAVWLAVSVYYYQQHSVRVKTITVNEEMQFENAYVVIKKISYEDFKQKDTGFNLPWYYKYILSLPRPLSDNLYSLMLLYSKPYEFGMDYGTMRVNGFIVNESKNYTESGSYLTNDFSIGYQGIHAGFTVSSSSLSNINYFEQKRLYTRPLEEDIKITITDRKNNETKTLVYQPEWVEKRYNFFNRAPRTMLYENLVNRGEFEAILRKGNLEEIKALVHPELRQGFAWDQIIHGHWQAPANNDIFVNYEGSHLGFDRVYSYNLMFDYLVEQPEQYQQKIYFIEDGDSWRIIDASLARTSPLIKLEQMNIEYDEVSFLDAVSRGDTMVVTLFLEAGMDYDVRDAGGRTALMLAVAAGFPDVVEMLVNDGADVRAKDDKGETALNKIAYTAREQNRERILELLNRGLGE